MGNQGSSAHVAMPGSGGQDFLAPRLPAPQFRTEAEHEALYPGRPEYEFFDEAFGLLNSSMQAQYRRLAEESMENVNRASRGRIPWSTIEGLNATTYTGAINQTAHLLQRFVIHGNSSYPFETVQHLREQVGEIISQGEGELRQANASGRNTADAERAQKYTLDCWRNARNDLVKIEGHIGDFDRAGSNVEFHSI